MEFNLPKEDEKAIFWATNGIEWAQGIRNIIKALENSVPVNFHKWTSLKAKLRGEFMSGRT